MTLNLERFHKRIISHQPLKIAWNYLFIFSFGSFGVNELLWYCPFTIQWPHTIFKSLTYRPDYSSLIALQSVQLNRNLFAFYNSGFTPEARCKVKYFATFRVYNAFGSILENYTLATCNMHHPFLSCLGLIAAAPLMITLLCIIRSLSDRINA